MNTFIIGIDPRETAKILDYRRLGKQRVEAFQLLRANLGLTKGWVHHPATKSWKGYEAYLLKVYIRAMMDEWGRRGYVNDKCNSMYAEAIEILKDVEPIPPPWFTERMFVSHKSNLIRKKPEYYAPLFPGVPDDIPYAWDEVELTKIKTRTIIE